MKEKRVKEVMPAKGSDVTHIETEMVFDENYRKGTYRFQFSEQRRTTLFVTREIRLLHWIFSITIPLPGLAAPQ